MYYIGSCFIVNVNEDFVVYCREFMKSDAVENPSGVQKVLQFMMAEQQMLNSKRVDLVEALRFVSSGAFIWETVTFSEISSFIIIDLSAENVYQI